MVGICAGQPLDTLRVRLQQQGSQQTSTAAILRASGATAGLRDLFRGMSYPLYTIALQVGMQLSCQCQLVPVSLQLPQRVRAGSASLGMLGDQQYMSCIYALRNPSV